MSVTSRDLDAATPLSLLERLRSDEASTEAWDEFVERYGRLLYRWCRRWGLQECDAQDVTQDTLMAVVRQIGRFQYLTRGSFRAWLKTIANRCWYRIVESRNRAGDPAGGNVTLDALSSLLARGDLEQEFQRQAEREILALAMARVKRRVEPRSWEAFRLTTLEHRSGPEVAAELDMRVGAIYMARWRIQKLIGEEAARIDPEP